MDRQRHTTPKGAEARARVITEATRVFARDGYRAGSLARIAEAAGLTQQGLLHYFPNKAALVLAVVSDRERRTSEAVRDSTGQASALDTFIDALRHNMSEPHLVELMTVLSAESTNPGHPTHQWFIDRYEDLIERLAAAVTEEQRSGRWIATSDPRRAARMIVAMADGMRLQRLLGHPALDHADVVDSLVDDLREGTIRAR